MPDDLAPQKRRNQDTQTDGGEGAPVSAAPTDKPVGDDAYVGVDAIYRNYAEDTHKPLEGEGREAELLKAAKEAEDASYQRAERRAVLGVVALAPNPNEEGFEPTADEERLQAGRQQVERLQRRREAAEKVAEQRLAERREAEAEETRAAAERLRAQADAIEASVNKA